MKTLILLILIVLLPNTALGEDWTTADKVLLGGALTATAIDWGQSRYIAKHPEFYERNPILGKHPSVGAVDRYFVVAIAGTVGLSYALPKEYRRWFLGGLLLVETAVVVNNHRIGIRASF